MTTNTGYRGLDAVPQTGLEAIRAWLVTVRDKVNLILQGKVNVTGTLTLTASVSTENLQDPRIGDSSAILLMPMSANAAAEIGNGTLWFGASSKGSIVVNHANNAQVDRTFTYVVIG